MYFIFFFTPCRSNISQTDHCYYNAIFTTSALKCSGAARDVGCGLLVGARKTEAVFHYLLPRLPKLSTLFKWSKQLGQSGQQ